MIGFFVPTYVVIFEDGARVKVTVDSSTQRLYAGETNWEIAAAIACARTTRPHADVQDVKEA